MLLTGCSAQENGGGEGKDGSDYAAPDGGFVQEGYVGKWDVHLKARVEVAEVARLEDRTRTTIRFTSLEDEPVDIEDNVFSSFAAADDDINQFRLIDTVRQHAYGVHSDLGTDLPSNEQWIPGVTYEIVVFSPALEEGVDTVTVRAPGGIGEFAGVPVVEGEPETYPSGPPDVGSGDAPGEGDTVVFPVRDGDPEPLDEEYGGKGYRELYGSTIGVVQGREVDSERETVALRTDVLFAFDKAEVSDTAADVLEDVIEETRERADPEKPPITITGHTDGIGDDAYNQELSEQRAEAVKDILEEGLGSGYEYETVGRGSTEPLRTEGGEDDEEARAANRRVEISYAFKEDVVSATETEEEGEKEIGRTDPEEVDGPGTFRSHADLEPVASTDGVEQPHVSTPKRTWSIEVYPFYRDGAYLVTRFAIAHDGERLLRTQKVFNSGFGDFPFSVTVPETGTTYLNVKPDEEGRFSSAVGAAPFPPTRVKDVPQYGYYYVPAPPSGVESVTFDAGPFGTFEDVPIEE
ncbi:OmpA family protein [Nocardiopsis halophila]|uniref:OmpA family protein n=1 Tax=Nocardiopsis halophila TaxID=141692 RepID=UPI001F4CB7C5|nr:OmpA family protein [Nocardiopsis halophila]